MILERRVVPAVMVISDVCTVHIRLWGITHVGTVVAVLAHKPQSIWPAIDRSLSGNGRLLSYCKWEDCLGN